MGTVWPIFLFTVTVLGLCIPTVIPAVAALIMASTIDNWFIRWAILAVVIFVWIPFAVVIGVTFLPGLAHWIGVPDVH